MPRRLQGTDGVRRPVALSTDESLMDLTPQEAFLTQGVMTEQFVELYLYCRCRWLIDTGAAREGDPFVVGWDPRDCEGLFTGAALTGVVTAGLDAISVGVVPTPAIPLLTRLRNAAGGAMITASHNPASFNGIKIFTRHGFKLLPGDDDTLSALVHSADYASVSARKPGGKIIGAHADAMATLLHYHLDSRNSWIENPEKLSNAILVIDCANGALATLAPQVARQSGFFRVIACNVAQDGRSVNRLSGVADIESAHLITRSMVAQGGPFAKHTAIGATFDEAERNRPKLATGELSLTLAVFDGDGDRCFRLEYDPKDDTLHLLTGDELSLLQSRHLMRNSATGHLLVNTIESDLSVAIKACEENIETLQTGVGDKWVLLRAMVDLLSSVASPELRAKIDTIATAEVPSADAIETIIRQNAINLTAARPVNFLIGAEESGHVMSAGLCDRGVVFSGDGLKSLLNSFAATALLVPKEIHHPFPPGFKRTNYAYYVDKEQWRRGSAVWREVHEAVEAAVTTYGKELTLTESTRPEERDMLALTLTTAADKMVGALYIRNSGTEDKTGVTLRSAREYKDLLLSLGAAAVKPLLGSLKSTTSRFACAERELLQHATQEGAPRQPVADLDAEEYRQLLLEVANKQGLLQSTEPGARPTPLGEWLLRAPRSVRQ